MRKNRKQPDFQDYESLEGVGRRLPIFKGYTVDPRCREFRRPFASTNMRTGALIGGLEIIDFDSPKGEKLLVQLLRVLDVDSVLFREISETF